MDQSKKKKGQQLKALQHQESSCRSQPWLIQWEHECREPSRAAADGMEESVGDPAVSEADAMAERLRSRRMIQACSINKDQFNQLCEANAPMGTLQRREPREAGGKSEAGAPGGLSDR